MKAPADRLISLYYGPATATPGELRADNIPARLVADTVFIDVNEPLSESIAYLTITSIEPTGPTVTETADGIYSFDFNFADRVAIEPLADPTHYVQRVELRHRLGSPDYWRAYLALCNESDILVPCCLPGIPATLFAALTVSGCTCMPELTLMEMTYNPTGEYLPGFFLEPGWYYVFSDDEMGPINSCLDFDDPDNDYPLFARLVCNHPFGWFFTLTRHEQSGAFVTSGDVSALCSPYAFGAELTGGSLPLLCPESDYTIMVSVGPEPLE